MRVAFFVSDHGYGHIMRNLPVAEELIARGHEVTIVTGKNQAMIADQYLHGRAKSVVLPTDAGLVVYSGTLTIDVENTIEAVKANIDKWPDMMEQAAELRADVFVVDIVPWALPAAKKMGIPSYFMANFTWIDQYETFLPAGLLRYYEDAYSLRDRVLYYDLANEPTRKRFGQGTDVGFVARPFHDNEVQTIRNRHKRKTVFLSLGVSNSGLDLPIDVSGLLTYFFVKESKEKTEGNSFLFRLFAVALCGALTHYYCILYAVLISVTYGIWLLFGKKYRYIFKFSSAMVASGSMKHLFPGVFVWQPVGSDTDCYKL